MKITFDLIIAEGADFSTAFCSTDYEQLSIPGFFDREVTTDGDEATDE